MRLLFGLLLSIATVTASAAPTAAPTAAPSATPATARVFVSGHSLTDVPMPPYLARIAESLGTPLQWDRQYMVGSAIKHRARGRGNESGWDGYTQGDNRDGSGMNVVDELRRQPYDVLVITEQHGLVDSLVWHDTVRHLRHYHELFIAGNPNGRSYFYEPWLGIPGKTEVQRWVAYERTASPLWQCIATRINRSLAAEGRSDRIASLPTALALAELVDRATQGAGVDGVSGPSAAETIDRLFVDNVHLRPLGAYYVALVVYARLFERSPSGAWAPEGVSPVQAASLQRIAGEVMARYRAENRPLTAAACDATLKGAYLGLYFDHMRDDYWAQQEGSAARTNWRRFKHTLHTRWRLWRRDPMAWDMADDAAGYWFPAP